MDNLVIPATDGIFSRIGVAGIGLNICGNATCSNIELVSKWLESTDGMTGIFGASLQDTDEKNACGGFGLDSELTGYSISLSNL